MILNQNAQNVERKKLTLIIVKEIVMFIGLSVVQKKRNIYTEIVKDVIMNGLKLHWGNKTLTRDKLIKETKELIRKCEEFGTNYEKQKLDAIKKFVNNISEVKSNWKGEVFTKAYTVRENLLSYLQNLPKGAIIEIIEVEK